MVMRMGGLASGMDIDSLVEKLMQAERVPLDKTFQKKQTFEWQRDAYRNVNKTTQKFNQFLKDSMRLQSSMMKKTATSSNESLAAVKATSTANGTLNIESVTQLATSTQMIGSQTGHTGTTKLSTLVGESVKSVEIQAIDKNGNLAEKPTTITFDPTKDTVDDLVKKINQSNAGVTALFENGQLSLTANNSGSVKSGNGEIVFGQGKELFDALGMDNATTNSGKNAIFKVNGISMERSSNTFTISGFEVSLKSTFNAKSGAADRLAAAQVELNNAKAALPGLEAERDSKRSAYESYRDNTYKNAYKNTFGENNLTAEQQEKFNKLSNVGKVALLNSGDLSDLQSLNIDYTDADSIKSSINNSSLTDEQKVKLLRLSSDDLQALQSPDGAEILERAHQVDFENSYKTLDKKFLNDLTTDDIAFLSEIKGKTGSEIEQILAGKDDAIKDKFGKMDPMDLNKLADLSGSLEDFQQFSAIEKTNNENAAAYKTAENNAVAGQKRLDEAQKSYDNAKAASDSVANDTSPTVAAVNLTSTTDTKSIKDSIQEFVKNYNEMVDSLNGLLKEKKYRDYPPLTSEQRKDMSENEQKLWDEKAKSGLLRSDSLIRDGLAKIRTQFMSSVNGLGDDTIDSLAEIGITTSDKLSDGGKLKINDAKLDAALAKDPDQVVQIFTNTGSVTTTTDENGRKVTKDSRGISQRLTAEIETLQKNIEKKAGREGATDQTHSLGKKIVESDDRITKLQAKLKDIEARYWKQFSAMESAINKANQQSSMFMQGGGF
ncbi:flagellar filament capping protein FliD [Lysinibacillus xylanilyticus]|uniref:flagellar filament capping protein FliD n=1 Tax=Lysinibacillus xylanilyticus TaxID=582475 RepID=UPI002B24BA98|nr:flagellar filament capping protein FliD [Lysinibacillus xylanilyticus]MEB2298481.1 flagellar filament capping protein FliD [Lysinibacillus xylanilyticus]